MVTFAALTALAAFGVAETVYLIRKRRLSMHPVCLIGGRCGAVLGSKYNRTLGIHNDVLGLLFYLSALAAIGILAFGLPPATLWIRLFRIALIVGSAMSAYFAYLQWQVIGAWCFWCLMSAFTVWTMTALAFALPL